MIDTTAKGWALCRRHVRWVAWSLFLLACFGLAGVRWVRNEQFWADHQAQMARQDRLLKLGFQRRDEVLAILRDHSLTRQEMEAKLNNGRPFSLETQQDRQVTQWKDPVGGQVWTFTFRGNKYAGHSSHWGTGDVLRQYPPIQRTSYDGRSEPIRQRAVHYASWAWLGLAAATLVGAGRRRLLAELLLAMAILCTIGWAVAPAYSLSLTGVSNNDHLASGVLMLALSAAVLAACVVPHRGPFQFSLRTMLGVMTLFAILLSLGTWICFVALIVILAALGTYYRLSHLEWEG